MGETGRQPRIVIDYEHGGFNFADPAGSLQFFIEYRTTFGSFDDVWLFHDLTAPLIRGFYNPISAPARYGIPHGRGPLVVLIDDRGDQLWLSGASCGGTGQPADAARKILNVLGLSVATLADYDEMHFWKGDLVASRSLTDSRPGAPPGRTSVRDGRIVCRMEFDQPATTPDSLREIWEMATQSHGWLGAPTSLTLYDSRSRAQRCGHEGCQLVAVGETGRELWLQLPEADTYEHLAFSARPDYNGSITEYEGVKAAVFKAVGVNIAAAHRTWRDVLRGRHVLPAEVINWP